VCSDIRLVLCFFLRRHFSEQAVCVWYLGLVVHSWMLNSIADHQALVLCHAVLYFGHLFEDFG
jgi:hypothetical protein